VSNTGVTTITIELDLNGVRVPVVLEANALAVIADEIQLRRDPEAASEFLTIPEAA
jgi:hypothetical protein